MRQVTIFLAMAIVFSAISCGPKSHMIVNNKNMATESQATIEGDASAVAKENRDANRDLAMAELYKKLAIAQTPEEQDELLKAIAVMEGKTKVPFFRGESSYGNHSSVDTTVAGKIRRNKEIISRRMEQLRGEGKIK